MRLSRWMIGGGALLAAAWSGGWMYVRSQAEPQLNRQISALRSQGTDISYGGLSIGGFPFGYDGRIADPQLTTRALMAHPRTLTPEIATISAAAPFLNARASVLEGRRARFDLPPEARLAAAFADETWTLDLTSENGAALGELDGGRVRGAHTADRLQAVVSAGAGEAGRLEAEELNVSFEADAQTTAGRRPSATFSADRLTLSGAHQSAIGDVGGRTALTNASGVVDLRDDCSASLQADAVEAAFAAVLGDGARGLDLSAQNADLDAVGACEGGRLRLDRPGRLTLNAAQTEAKVIQDPRYVSFAADSARVEAAIDGGRMRANASLSGVAAGEMPFAVAQAVFAGALQGAAPSAPLPPRPLTAQTVTASVTGPAPGSPGTMAFEATMDGAAVELSALALPVPVSGTLPIGRASMSTETDMAQGLISALRLKAVEADILGAEVRAAGAFSVNAEGRPVGDVTVRVANMADALREAQQRGLINPMQMMMVQFSLAAAAPMDRETGVPTLRLRADGDQIFLNGTAIMEAPALRAPRG